jgi:drug/metabolite transporter (DMT)-like permease
MSAAAWALVLSGAAFHALWNIVAKRTQGGTAFVWLFGVVSVVAFAPLALWEAGHGLQALTPAMSAAVCASALIHVAYSLVLQRGYRDAPFSVVYPVARGSGPMFSIATAICLWGERPNAWGWMGVLAVLAGIVVSAGSPAGAREKSADTRAMSGVGWGLATGLCIAGYTVVDGWAVKQLGMSPLLFYGAGLALRTGLLAPMALSERDALREQWRRSRCAIVIVGLLSPAAYTLVLMAVRMAPLSYVAPVREVSMLIGTFLGAHLLRESIRGRNVAGAALMLSGVIAIALA